MIEFDNSFFKLDNDSLNWVKNTFFSLSLNEKIGQIVCSMGVMTSKRALNNVCKNPSLGGIMFRPIKYNKLSKAIYYLQKNSKVPMLIASNLEYGGCGAFSEGTDFSSQLGVKSTGNKENAYRLGYICSNEASKVGVNLGFAPVCDIDLNFRNPITNLRTFGNNTQDILDYTSSYIKGCKENNFCPTIKHFPGDGVDERDQHLLTSVNDLEYDEWRNTYGSIYKSHIDNGIKAIMVGHIALPKYIKYINPNSTKEEAYLPSSLNKYVLNDLLRVELGFKGLVITDSTTMLGFMSCMKRETSLPLCVENGIDMILFTKNTVEDIEYLKKGIENKILSINRLDQAVIKVLMLKASLGLDKLDLNKYKHNTLLSSNINFEEHKRFSIENANNSISLVKDTQNLLPLSNKKYKNIYLNIIEPEENNNKKIRKKIKDKFIKEGFNVDLRNRKLKLNLELLKKGIILPGTIKLLLEVNGKVNDFKKKYDLIIVILNYQTTSNQSTVRVKFNTFMGMGNDVPWYTSEIPTLCISLANPYHLLDVPMMKTFINAYNSNDSSIDMLIEKLMGRSEFKGTIIDNVFCNKIDTKL